MIILVCGGRDYFNQFKVNSILDLLQKEFKAKGQSWKLVVHGDCSGVDRIAGNWATKQGIHECKVPALWDYYERLGKKKVAGFERNSAMSLLNIDLCIGIKGANGTNMMCEIMKDKGVEVRRFL